MKIALGQINVVAGDIQANLKSMKAMIEQAKNEHADLIVFPEMAVGGYFIADKWTDDDWVFECEKQNELILSWSDGIGIIWGNVSRTYQGSMYQGSDGRSARFNSVFFAHEKQWAKKENGQLGQSVKHLLPNYRMFDDARYFTSGITLSMWNPLIDDLSPFEVLFDGKKQRIFLQICEDLWDEDYPTSPTQRAVESKSDWIINVSASVWTFNKEKSRQKQILKKVKKYSDAMPHVVYVNACGMQNNGKNILLFDGGSSIYRPDGSILYQANEDFLPSCPVVDVSSTYPVVGCEKKLLKGLIEGIKQFDRQVFPFKPKWIIGLSGGLDSSINAALLTLALGKERMIGVNMPTQYNSEKTIQNAKNLARITQMEYLEGSIEPMVDATLATMEQMGEKPPYDSLTIENIQARLRGHLLSSLASLHHAIIVNNGNKVETALGYCTMYGDTIGAISPLGDLTKMQLFELAEEINLEFGCEVIPKNLLPTIKDQGMFWDMAPSAELKDQQIDPMKWGYHDWLISYITEYPGYRVESFLQMIEDKSIQKQPVYAWMQFYGLTDSHMFFEDLEWVLKMMRIAVFKRIQLPPNITLSRGSFGFDFREAQVNFQPTERYLSLKQAIINRKSF